MIQSHLKIPKTTNFLHNKPLRNCVKTLGLAFLQAYLFGCADQIVLKSYAKQANLEFWEHLSRAIARASTPTVARQMYQLHFLDQNQLLASLLF